jgi:type I restriction enzyme, S subunit
VSELTNLPDGWIWTTINETCSIMSGQTPKGIEDSLGETEEIPWFRVSDMNTNGNEKILTIAQVYLSQTRLEKLGIHVRPKGTIVFPKRGGAIATNKKRILKRDSAYDLNIMGIFPILIENLFFWHWFQTIDLKKISDGSNVPQINNGNIEPLEFPLPPLNEQRRIVRSIEQLTDRSNKARAALEDVPKLIAQFRQSVLAAAFRGDLTADWRENNPDVEPASELLERIKIDRRKRWEEACRISKQNGSRQPKLDKKDSEDIEIKDLEVIPVTWCWEKLVNIADLVGGVTKGRNFKGRTTIHVIYLRVANVQDGFLDLEEIKEIEVLPEDIDKYRLDYGDILFTEGGDRDKLGRGTIWRNEIDGCIHQNHVYRARLYSSEILPEYISLATKTEYSKDYFFNNASQTVNLASINMTTLGKLPIAIPPIAEQKAICDKVNKAFKILDSLRSSYQLTIEEINQLDRSILAKAFRGELVPQDPNDEPATVLLDRIRAEREQTITFKQRGKTTRKNSSKQLSIEGIE